MPEGAAHINVAFLFFAQPISNQNIGHQANRCHSQHQSAFDFRRRLKTLVGFVKNDDGDQENGQGIYNGDYNPYPVVSKGHAAIGSPFGLFDAVPRQAKGNDVGSDMSGVAQQRQTVRHDTTNDFSHQNDYA
jgi:hypothetical protein